MPRARIAERSVSCPRSARAVRKLGPSRASRVTAAIVTLTMCWFVTLFVQAQRSPSNSVTDAEATAFVCPMHPDYTLDIAGTCPRCGMALVRGAPFDVRDYGLELSSDPAVVMTRAPNAFASWIAVTPMPLVPP